MRVVTLEAAAPRDRPYTTSFQVECTNLPWFDLDEVLRRIIEVVHMLKQTRSATVYRLFPRAAMGQSASTRPRRSP